MQVFALVWDASDVEDRIRRLEQASDHIAGLINAARVLTQYRDEHTGG